VLALYLPFKRNFS